MGVSLICCLLLIFIPESPRYLVSVRNYEKAREVLTKIGRMNGTLEKDQVYYKKFEDEEEVEIIMD